MKKAYSLMTVLLMSSAIAIGAEKIAEVQANDVNVRGQPSISSEVVTQLQRGEKVQILEEITLNNPAEGEPARWAKIQLPANTPVWVSAQYIDPADKSVTADRLNIRAGPSQNYSVLGQIVRGTPVKPIRTVDNWIEIEPPVGAYAYVASELLGQTKQADSEAVPPAQTDGQTGPVKEEAPVSPPEEFAAAPTVPTEETAKEPELTPASEVDPLVNAEERAPSEESLPGPEREKVTPLTPVEIAAVDQVPSAKEDPSTGEPSPTTAPARRIVRREGIVRSTISIQAPTYFELINPETRKTINYLHSAIPGLDLKDFQGRRIIVSGEEGIDPRWPNTPVIEVETLQLAP